MIYNSITGTKIGSHKFEPKTKKPPDWAVYSTFSKASLGLLSPNRVCVLFDNKDEAKKANNDV